MVDEKYNSPRTILILSKINREPMSKDENDYGSSNSLLYIKGEGIFDKTVNFQETDNTPTAFSVAAAHYKLTMKQNNIKI